MRCAAAHARKKPVLERASGGAGGGIVASAEPAVELVVATRSISFDRVAVALAHSPDCVIRRGSIFRLNCLKSVCTHIGRLA
jgi:hypothetical protein